MAYISFDIGSSALKVGILSEDGKLIAAARHPLPLVKGPGGARESDPRSWVEAALSAGAEAVSAARSAGKLEIRALAVSGNGPTLLAADAKGEPIGPALSWLDRRAIPEAEEASAALGRPIDPSFYLPKALRLWRAPKGGAPIRWFFSCPEYLVFRLCGEALTYLPDEGFKRYIWDEKSLAALGLPADRFPPFAAPSTIAGLLLPEIASMLGVAPGLPVVSGFPDYLAAIVGAGAVSPGIACDRTGTSEALNLCADRPFPSDKLFVSPHPVRGLWNLSGGVSTAGAALAWLGGIFSGPSEGYGIEELLSDARSSPPGARGLTFLPYMGGERAPLWDGALRGAFVGLSLEHGRPDLARAACESLAFGLRLAADIARSAGFPMKLVRASGGAAADDMLNSIKADVLGVPVELPMIADCELAGDAAACALALGDASSLSQAADTFYATAARYEPDPLKPYEDAFGRFSRALSALATESPEVAR